jgi:hypothetical protein
MGIFNDALKSDISAPIRRSTKVVLGGKEVELFAEPLTGADLDRLMLRHKNFATAPTVNATVDLLIAKVQVESGDKAFDLTDKPLLIQKPLEWINKLRADLFPDQDVDLSDEAIEKELGN